MFVYVPRSRALPAHFTMYPKLSILAPLLVLGGFVNSRAAFGQPLPAPPPGVATARAGRTGIRELPTSDGMTVDQAVERFLKENLELRTMHDEIAMASADVEAAGQAPQALLLTEARVGGIKTRKIQPRELISRAWINTLVARAARCVVEAQYQDAVRTRVDTLYGAFVDVQSAQTTVSAAEAALRGMDELLKLAQGLQKAGQVSEAAVVANRVNREIDASSLDEAKIALLKAELVLADLLNCSVAQIEQAKVPAELEIAIGRVTESPPLDELIQTALTHRPDLRAYQLGIHRAQLDWLKALIEPLTQITTYRLPDGVELAPKGQAAKAPAARSMSLVTLPMPVFNRGKLKRSAINVDQTRTELTQLERKVRLEVSQARMNYDLARKTVNRFRDQVFPLVQSQRDGSFQQWKEGEATMADFLQAQSKSNETAVRFQNARVSLRRSMLALNTAVGKRVMP
jgi:cobalt-zinc-cadmium efflux system outer membrane protein